MPEDFEYLFRKKSNECQQKRSVFNYLKSKILAYMFASRIPAIIITAAFLFLGKWTAAESIPFMQTSLMLLFLVSVQFINGFINSFFDKKIDVFARKHTLWIFKYISSKEMIAIPIIFSLLSLSLLWYFFKNLTFIVGLITILVTIFYSSPPLRFKTKPPLDIFSNMLILGTFPFILGWLSTDTKLQTNTYIYGLLMGLPVIAYCLIIGWHDIKTDADFGIKTTCVLLGYDWTIFSSLFLWIVLCILSSLIFGINIVTISFLIILPVLFLLTYFYTKYTDYNVRQKNIIFFLSIATNLWLLYIFFSLSLLSCSILTILFFLLQLLYLLINYEIMSLLSTKK